MANIAINNSCCEFGHGSKVINGLHAAGIANAGNLVTNIKVGAFNLYIGVANFVQFNVRAAFSYVAHNTRVFAFHSAIHSGFCVAATIANESTANQQEKTA